MEITNKDVKVLGRVAAITTEGIVASAEQVFDDQYGDSGEFQNVINQNFTDTQQSIKDQLADLTKHHEEDILAVNQRIQTEVFPAISDVNNKLIGHTSDENNPHSVTKAQVGLSNVDNTSDANKPISTAQQNKFDEVISDYTKKISDESTARSNADKQLQSNIDDLATSSSEQLQTHINDTGNPHEVTKSQVGLGNVTNDAQVKRSEMGAANGVAQLGDDGRVPSSQLPSYVDDVLEYDNLASFPQTGESGKIYVAKDTNLTYRWTGSGYAEVSQSLALGETSSTAFPGDRGKNLETSVGQLNTFAGTFPQQIVLETHILGNSENKNSCLRYVVSQKNGNTWSSPITRDEVIHTVTTDYSGLMSAADKQTLDQIKEGLISDGILDTLPSDILSDVTNVTQTNSRFTVEFDKYHHSTSDGYQPESMEVELPLATSSLAGIMSAADKEKLGNIDAENILYNPINGTLNIYGTVSNTPTINIKRDDLTRPSIILSEGGQGQNASIVIQHGSMEGGEMTIMRSGITIADKTSSDLLNAAGGTTTLKTINGQSLLGSGDITIEGGGTADSVDWDNITNKPTIPTVQSSYTAGMSNYIYSNYTDSQHRALTDLQIVRSGDTVNVEGRSWGQPSSISMKMFTIPTASASFAGLMSTTDKTKLDGINLSSYATQSWVSQQGFAKGNFLPLNGSQDVTSTIYMHHNGSGIDPVLSISNGDPDIDALHVDGCVTVTADIYSNRGMMAPGFYETSDIYLKENVQSISDEDINKISNVKSYSFNFISDKNKTKKYGVIAQELESAGINNLVILNNEGNKSVDYISFLILKIQSLEKRIEQLESERR